MVSEKTEWLEGRQLSWGSLGKRVHTADRESHSRKSDRSAPSRLGRLPREKIAVLSAKIEQGHDVLYSIVSFDK
jgi:hypothetical protein